MSSPSLFYCSGLGNTPKGQGLCCSIFPPASSLCCAAAGAGSPTPCLLLSPLHAPPSHSISDQLFFSWFFESNILQVSCKCDPVLGTSGQNFPSLQPSYLSTLSLFIFLVAVHVKWVLLHFLQITDSVLCFIQSSVYSF